MGVLIAPVFDIENDAVIPVDRRSASMTIFAHPIVRDTDNKLWATSPSRIDVDLINSITTARKQIRFRGNTPERFVGKSTQTIVLESLDQCFVENVEVDFTESSLQNQMTAHWDGKNVVTLTLGKWAGSVDEGHGLLLIQGKLTNGQQVLTKIPIVVEPRASHALYPPLAIFDGSKLASTIMVYTDFDSQASAGKHLQLRRLDQDQSFSVETHDHEHGKRLVIEYVPALRSVEDSRFDDLRFKMDSIPDDESQALPLGSGEIVVPVVLSHEQ